MGNIIGLDDEGTDAVPNALDGIAILQSSTNTIGGDSAAERNVISGNGGQGVYLGDIPLPTNNVISGNYIGTDVTGELDRGNTGDGVRVDQAVSTTVGGTSAAEGNLISGNNQGGVRVNDSTSNSNVIKSNMIGTDDDGVDPLPNTSYGVWIRNAATNTTVGSVGDGNQIWFNGGDGVRIASDAGNGHSIRGNSIRSNDELGIDLNDDGITGNDLDDGDGGPNNQQNYPFLSDVSTSASTTIAGTLNSTPNTTFDLDFYSSPSCDPTGFGEGATHLGSDDVTTDGNGDVAGGFSIILTPTVAEGEFITATATDPSGNTSEFSQCELFGPLIVNSTNDDSDANTVDPTCDTGLGVGGTECTLRAAIQQANGTTGADVIEFDIPGTGPHTIAPASVLPIITNPVTIDGYTEPGALAATSSTSATLMVELDGTNVAGAFDGLHINTTNSFVGGLAVNGFGQHGIHLEGSGHTIAGNYIGTDITGETDLGNTGSGLLIESSDSTIGGDTPADRNVISGNQFGAFMTGASNNVVQGNYIGTDADGNQQIQNDTSGIRVGGPDTTIGGTSPGQENLIAFNGGDGVLVVAADSSIRGNSIHSNGDLGIDLGPDDGVTGNDTDDADGGANNLQNFPVVTDVSTGASTTITGTLDTDATSATPYEIDFFANDTCDPTGFGEGQTFIGSRTVTTDVNGDAPIDEEFSSGFPPDFTLPEGDFITATATDSNGNTSEFSQCELLGPLVVNSIGDGIDASTDHPGCDTGGLVSGAPECTLRAAIQQANATTGADVIEFDIPGAVPHTIAPSGSSLPIIEDPVSIDGATDPDTDRIELDGTAAVAGIPRGFEIRPGGGGSTLEGFVINDFDTGIEVVNNNGNVIRNNYLGTDVTGTVIGGNSLFGVRLELSNGNTIGGSTAAARNVISGNGSEGIQVSNSDNNTISGNYIGTDATGSVGLGNKDRGVRITNGSDHNVLGGDTPGERNVISANGDGLGIESRIRRMAHRRLGELRPGQLHRNGRGRDERSRQLSGWNIHPRLFRKHGR